jgi:hypothetical protein
MRHGLIEVVLPHVRDDDLAARLGEDLRLAEARAGPAARDECYLAFEICHVLVSFCFCLLL